MRVAVTIVFAILSALAAAPTHAFTEQTGPSQGLSIKVEEGGWGSALPQEIETVLYSVAAELLSQLPGKRLGPIVVAHSYRNPVVLYEKGARGEYQVFLTTRDKLWAHYAYEFAHELAHILANYEHYKEVKNPHQWFEETICEVASLYTLKQLAISWRQAPPHPEGADYAPAFQEFAERLMGEQHRRLPEGFTLATWLREALGPMKSNPYIRDHNEVVANLLLPLFEENPKIWEAVAYLNAQQSGSDFKDYLQNWYDNAPEEYKDIIRYVMGLFGLLDDGAATLSAEPKPFTTQGKPMGASGNPASPAR